MLANANYYSRGYLFYNTNYALREKLSKTASELIGKDYICMFQQSPLDPVMKSVYVTFG